MTDFSLLTKVNYLEKIKWLLGQDHGKVLRIAVSYWGNGVSSVSNTNLMELIGQIKNSEVRVICDLGHPACRVQPIETLLDHKVVLRTLDGLHAKVLLTQSGVIIGSANMSRAALERNDSNDSNKSNFEAGILSESNDLIRQTEVWFDSLWKSNSCIQIDQAALKKKKEEHKNVELPARLDFGTAKPRLRTFESFVGEKAGVEYRKSLCQLGFKYSGGEGTRNMKRKFSEIENTAQFVSSFAKSLRKLVQDSTNKRGTFTKTQNRIPVQLFQLLEQPDGSSYQALLKKMRDLVENPNGKYLSIQHNEDSYSIRLGIKEGTKRKRACTVALIHPSYVRACQDR